MTLTEDEIEELSVILFHYLKPEYRRLCDFETVIQERNTLTVDGETVYAYECPCQTIYLNTENYPITYGKQLVDIEDDGYYYQFVEDDTINTVMDRVTSYEWKRTEENIVVGE